MLWLCAFLTLILCLPASHAEEAGDFVDSLIEMTSAWLDENPPEDVLAAMDIPAIENWQGFWRTVEDALQSGSLEDLAWILPEIQTALGYLASVPGGKPYADWLRQRLDYFTLAEEMVRSQEKAPDAGRKPAPRPGPRIPVAPSARPPRAPPPVSQAAPARIETIWVRKLSRRPPPPEADMLVPSLKEVFAAEGVPPEWVWMAEVESSLNPEARSPAGAVGLFQFMPETANRFGLKTRTVDERKIPHKSARAAAQYLRFLYRQFGSWPLTLAAYNAGEGTVSRAVRKEGSASYERIASALPVETQMYVPKVLATVALREGVNPRTLPAPFDVRRLD